MKARLFCAVFPVILPLSALAHEPEVVIEPADGTPVYVSSFPATVDVSFTVTHDNLHAVRELDVTVDAASLPGFPTQDGIFTGNPVACAAVLAALTTNCTASGDTASLTVPFVAPEPGAYTIGVSAKHGNRVGEDVETIAYEQSVITVEYPAPPAVANAYLKSSGLKLNPVQRGCILSTIAANHAHDAKYGPKGGPYEQEDIENDVDLAATVCPKK